MKHFIFCLTLLLPFSALADAKKEEIPCAKNTEVEKIMKDKGYELLLNMTRKENNQDNIIESLWIGGQSAIITGTTKNSDTSCLLFVMNGVVINPLTVEGIWENYKKQTKQKDI